MRIRGKLLCSFLIITILPILLLFGTIRAIYQVQMEDGVNLMEPASSVTSLFSNPVQFMNQMTEEIYEDMIEDFDRNAYHLENEQQLEKYNTKLQWKYSFLVIKKEGKYQYIGKKESFLKIENRIPTKEQWKVLADSGSYVGGENAFIIKRHSVTFSDGKKGYFYVVTMIDGLLSAIRSIAVQFVVSFLAIILFTACLLMLWIYSGIVRPINILKNATHKMRDGELDFSIEAKGKDEIGMLCQDFEEMRLRLKESTEMRLRYEQEMRELVSNISHDLKTPLTAIEGYTEGILDGVAATPEKQEKYLRTIYKKAKEMAMLVDELSTSSKIENGIVPYNIRYVNINDYFEDCVEEIEIDLGLQGIRLQYQNEVEKNIRVAMDSEQLKRVINNIIGNAVKYLGEQQGCILIHLVDEQKLPKNIDYIEQKKEKKRQEKESERKQGKEKNGIKSKKNQQENMVEKQPTFVRIEIRDNGCGIDETALPHIFERFYRADASRHSGTGGSGLGLAIAAKIIQDQGGRIWAESRVGEGTSIFFTLQKEDNKNE